MRTDVENSFALILIRYFHFIESAQEKHQALLQKAYAEYIAFFQNMTKCQQLLKSFLMTKIRLSTKFSFD